MAMRCRYYGKLVWKGRVSHDGDDLDSVFTFDISRGLIFGIWSACASVGNIIGAALAAAFIQYGYEYPFLVCCILLIACAMLVRIQNKFHVELNFVSFARHQTQ